MNNKELCLIEFFKKITNEINNRNVAIFFGAGLSINSGNLSVYEIIDSILSSLEYNGIQLFDEDIITVLKGRTKQFEDFLNRIYDDMDINVKNKDKIFEILFNALYGIGSPNNNHIIISQLINQGFVKKVYSTNIDTHLEDCYKNLFGSPLETYILGNSTQKNSKYFKLHGCISENKTILNFLSKIAEKNQLNKLQPFIDDLLINGDHRYILFMGYSFSDVYDIVKIFENISLEKKGKLDKEIIILAHEDNSDIYSNHITSYKGNKLKTIHDYNNSIKNSIPTRKIHFDNFKITILKYNTDKFMDYLCNEFGIKCNLKKQTNVSSNEIKSWVQGIDEYYRLLMAWRFNYESGQEYFLIENPETKSVMFRALENALRYSDLNLDILNKKLARPKTPIEQYELSKQVILNKKHKTVTLIALGRFKDAESILYDLILEIDRISQNNVPNNVYSGLNLFLKLDVNSNLLYLNYCKVLLNKYSKNELIRFVNENEHYYNSLNVDKSIFANHIVNFKNQYLIASLRNHLDISVNTDEIYFKNSIYYYEEKGRVEYLAFVYMEYAKFLKNKGDKTCELYIKMAYDLFENLGYDEYLRFCKFDPFYMYVIKKFKKFLKNYIKL